MCRMRCTRSYRRFILKYFGGTKLFLVWCLVTFLVIYAIDTVFFAKLRDQSYIVSALEPQHASKKSIASDAAVDKSLVPSDKGPSGPKQLDKEPSPGNPPVKQLEQRHEADKVVDKKPSEVVGIVNKTADVVEAGDNKRKCGMTEACPAGQYAYYLKSGVGRDGSPVICFNDNYIMSAVKQNANRGLNVVVINDKTLNVETIKTFDVYQDDSDLVRFFRDKLDDKRLVLVATLDEASYHLTDEGRRLISLCGSTLINSLKFRDNFIMIGQKGLKAGLAIEKLLPRETGNEFGKAVEIRGCTKLPLGTLKPVSGGLKLGQESENCGVLEACGPQAFSAHLFTGDRNVELPKICVNGKYVMAAGLNDAGRGLNIAVVNPKTKEVVRVGHFDTFNSDSSNLEIFLEMLNDGEIILVVTFDEASTKISDLTRHLFNELGSALIQNVRFRDMWVFVGYKGMQGFSDIEQIEYAGGSWPKPIDKRLCVPTVLTGKKIQPDPLSSKNAKRRTFCSKYDGYGDFCEASRVDDLLTPAPLSDKSLENSPIFKVPVAVIPGLNFNALRMQLETLIMNPGIQPSMVTVFHSDQSAEELSQLAELFNFKTVKLSGASKYSRLMQTAVARVWGQYPEAKHVIILEEEVIPSQDFLEFMAQCLPSVEADETLIGVSAWNVNGYDTASTIPTVAYRTETFPGLGFLLKKTFYDKAMSAKMAECCSNRTWDGWLVGQLGNHEMIVPDVSRVYRRPYEGLTEQMNLLSQLFNQRRATHLDRTSKLRNADMLTKDKYEEELDDLVKQSSPLNTANVKDCLIGSGLGFYIPEISGNIYSVYYEQHDLKDQRILLLLCKCFRLFYVENLPARGLHEGLLRFSYKGNMMFFIGSKTKYYRHKPADSTPVRLSDLSSRR